jgi:hypothetical protein
MNNNENGGYKSGYYLQLSEELFKYAFFLLFIVFGAIYYYNFILPPDYSLIKLFGLYFIVYIIFGIFYILLPLRRMLFSNLQVYKDKKNLNARYAPHIPAIIERAGESLKSHSADFGAPGAAPFDSFGVIPALSHQAPPAVLITHKTDYYTGFGPFFISSFVSAAVLFIAAVSNPAVNGMPCFNMIAASFLVINYIIITLGFKHFINRSDSTHRGFLFLFILFNLTYSIFICRFFSFFTPYQIHLILLDILIMSFYLYIVFNYTTVTAFIRTVDRNIYRIVYNTKTGSASEFIKLEFNYACRFVQTPYAIGFIIYDKEDLSRYGTPYYCDTSKDSVEKIFEVFSDRISQSGVEPAPAGANGADAAGANKAAVQFFAPLGVAELSKKYGAAQTIILSLINAVSIYMYWHIINLSVR